MDLHLLDVSKKIGTQRILSKVNFTVNSGETRLIIGASNSGKTCLIRVLLNIYKPSEGFVYFDGVEVSTQLFIEKRKEIAYIPQGLIFYENMTLYENLLFYDGIYFPKSTLNSRMQRAKSILNRLDLAGDSSGLVGKFGESVLSKLRLAQMMHFNHGLVIVDEPLLNESMEDKGLLMECLKRFQGQGTTVLMTSKSEIESSDAVFNTVSYLKVGGQIE